MRDILYQALLEKGLPESLCEMLTDRYLITDYTRMRMLGYVTRYSSLTPELVVDEMLAILSDVEMFAKKKQSETAQAKISLMYREGLNPDDEKM